MAVEEDYREKSTGNWRNEYLGIDVFEEALTAKRLGVVEQDEDFTIVEDYRSKVQLPRFEDPFKAGNTRKKQVYALPESSGL